MQLAQAIVERLSKEHAAHHHEMRDLWAMSARERCAAMYRGELTPRQLLTWASRRPEEIPLINGEFAFIAAHTPAVAESER